MQAQPGATQKSEGPGAARASRGGFERDPAAWSLLGGLVAMWGTAFVAIKIAVTSVSPVWVVAGRLAIAAVTLLALVRVAGLRLPPPGRIWLHLLALGILGNALPFFLVSWGQERIDSGVAGILMGANPLATLVLAHLLTDDRITRARAVGFATGFAGILLLLGPAARVELTAGGSALPRHAAVLAGALCYAANAVVARRLPPTHSLVVSASVVSLASLVMLPLALLHGAPQLGRLPAGALAAVAWLGLVPTAAATIVYFRLIASAGPAFASLTNYLLPLVALVSGIAVLRERPAFTTLAGLVLILAGIGLSEERARRRPTGARPASG